MRTSARRLGAVAVIAALVSGPTLVAPPALATPNNSAAEAAAGWLAAQVPGGLVHNDQYAFDDYGLTLDVYFALAGLEAAPATRTAVLDRIDDDPEAYVSYGTDHYAGATGKLATAVETDGRDPAGYGGVDLVTRLEGLVHTDADAELGRGVDQSAYGDYSNTIGQAWVVRGLVGAHSSRADDALGFLTRQQCAAGFFRGTLETTGTASTFTCDAAASGSGAPSIDATAFALEALTAARHDGVTGLDDEITRAADWLVGTQAVDGSFADLGTANANSTGLAATALASVGRTTAAEKAASWVLQRQVTASGTQSSAALSGEVGAIAYDDTAFDTGRRDGIPTDQRDQWRRATTQAAPALQSLPAPTPTPAPSPTPVPAGLPATTLAVSAPTGYRDGGSDVTVAARGLQPGERWTISLGGRSATGLANRWGTGRARLALPARTGSAEAVATGSTASRTGRTTVRVLGAARFRSVLRSRPAGRGGVQRVTVRGLAAHEPARLTYRGARIWTGRASASGAVVHRFRVGHALGVKTLVVRGLFSDRRVQTTFRVTR